MSFSRLTWTAVGLIFFWYTLAFTRKKFANGSVNSEGHLKKFKKNGATLIYRPISKYLFHKKPKSRSWDSPFNYASTGSRSGSRYGSTSGSRSRSTSGSRSGSTSLVAICRAARSLGRTPGSGCTSCQWAWPWWRAWWVWSPSWWTGASPPSSSVSFTPSWAPSPSYSPSYSRYSPSSAAPLVRNLEFLKNLWGLGTEEE